MEDLVSNIYARSVKPGADGKIIDTVDMTFRHGLDTPPLFDMNVDGGRIMVTARQPGGEVVLGLRIEGELARQIREQIEQDFTKRMLGSIGNFMAETKAQGSIVGDHQPQIVLGGYRGHTAKWWAGLLSKLIRWQDSYGGFVERQLPHHNDRIDGDFIGQEAAVMLREISQGPVE